MIIIKEGNKTANAYGFGAGIAALEKGLIAIGNPDPDVIICNDYSDSVSAIVLKEKTKYPLIASIHLFNKDNSQTKLLIDNCDGIIVYSKLAKKPIEEVYPELKVPIKVVYYGIDTTFWGQGEVARSNFLMFAGRTSQHSKNFFEIIKKVIEENIPFIVAGDVQYDRILGRIPCKHMSKEELKLMYQLAKLHILPSTFEPFGLVTLEAMACGCPVAVSTNSGVAELLNDDVAILFDPTKPFSLNDFMQRAESFDSNKLSEFAKQFDHISYAKNFMKAVSELTQEHFYSYFKEK